MRYSLTHLRENWLGMLGFLAAVVGVCSLLPVVFLILSLGKAYGVLAFVVLFLVRHAVHRYTWAKRPDERGVVTLQGGGGPDFVIVLYSEGPRSVKVETVSISFGLRSLVAAPQPLVWKTTEGDQPIGEAEQDWILTEIRRILRRRGHRLYVSPPETAPKVKPAGCLAVLVVLLTVGILDLILFGAGQNLLGAVLPSAASLAHHFWETARTLPPKD